MNERGDQAVNGFAFSGRDASVKERGDRATDGFALSGRNASVNERGDRADDDETNSPPSEGGVDAASPDGVVLSAGGLVSARDIIDFCKLHLADFKCPKTVHFVVDIPKGPTGKLLKRELAKLFAEARLK